jgi:RsiW-degrading membrane proteinase PrsW (M82 family)
MISVRDLIWVAIIFVAILIFLMLLRPVWILQRDRLTGKPIDDISSAKLLGWTLLFTVIAVLVLYIIVKCGYGHHKDDDTVY